MTEQGLENVLCDTSDIVLIVCLWSSFSHGRSHRAPHVRRILSQTSSHSPLPHLKRHNNNNSGKSFPSCLSVTDPEFTTAPEENRCWSWSRCRRHRYCLYETFSEKPEKIFCHLQRLHVEKALPQRKAGVCSTAQYYAVLRTCFWVLLCPVIKKVSLTSEVCGDWTGLRSVLTTVRQEGGESTGSFCSPQTR